MLIGKVLEKTQAEKAWQVCADKLADRIRNLWQNNTSLGLTQWEESLSEDPNALAGLREEGFKDLVGIDYIFKWWGGTDSEELAGEINVIWKLGAADGIHCYRSWLKIAERDFILGLYKNEREKREANRAAFRDAFAAWQALFAQL